MIQKVYSKEYAIGAACSSGVSWGESETDHCIYVGDLNSLRRAGVKVGVKSADEPSRTVEQLRRYQILLPYAKNDGTSFAPEVMEETLECLVNEFGGFTLEKDIVGAWCSGSWGEKEAETTTEKNYRITCDVPDTPENRNFFIFFKAVCLSKFEQEEIWLTSFPIDRIL